MWLRPIAKGQRVSLFLDEEPLRTINVKPGWNRYRFPLSALSIGEHSLRFWFRFTRFRGKRRSPAALSGLRLLSEEKVLSLPETWSGELELGGEQASALFAGPPMSWSYFFMLPEQARFLTRAGVLEGNAVQFRLRIERDGEPSVIQELSLGGGSSSEIEVDLSLYGGQPLRLSLETEGAPGSIKRAAWFEPRILMPGAPHSLLPPARNLLIWVVEGLRADRVGLGRGGDRAATPNLDLIVAEGAAAVDVWSGGAGAADGHQRLLRSGSLSLAKLLSTAGRTTGLLNAGKVPTELAEEFTSHVELGREPPDTAVLLKELDGWLDVRKRQPFFLYIASADVSPSREAPKGYQRLYERSRPERLQMSPEEKRRRESLVAYDAKVSAADYWIAQMLALLQKHEVLDKTAILITSAVGQKLLEPGGGREGHSLLAPLLLVPLVIWHPQLKQGPRALGRGGDLADVAATALSLLGVERPEAWDGREMATALFNSLPLKPRPSHARLGNHVVARFGHWLLQGRGSRGPKLWNLDEDPNGKRELSADHPIGLRTLKDSMKNYRDQPSRAAF